MRGGWIEIKIYHPISIILGSPTPCGVGGLKSKPIKNLRKAIGSHPMRGGWIEIPGEPGELTIQRSVPPHAGWVD